ncbi:MAG: Rpn family recombination-promoting nuclease/putative transposase [Thiotrichaceae bacterium]
MHPIYDRGYKKLFSNKALFQQLIESFVPFAWVNELDFEHCELLDKTFISKEYEQRESDVIYKIQLRGRTAYVVILIEFQSSPDKFMALRVLHYIASFYMRLAESEEKLNKLPAVFPIVIYSGQDKWTVPTNLAALIENNELLGEFALQFNYFKIAENEVSVERLLEIGNTVSALFLGEAHYDRGLLIQALSKLCQHEDRQLVSILFNYFEQLFNHNKLDEVDWRALDQVRSEQEINMFLENMKICDDMAFQKGKLEGIYEGEQRGKLEGKLETAKAMLAEGLDVPLITKVTGLDIAEIDRLRH